MAYGDRFGGGNRFNERRSFAPVKVGDELDLKIEAVGEKGDGIAKKDGFVLFVPNTKEGDEVKVKVTRVLRRVGFAEVVGAGSAPAEEPEEEAPAEKQAEEAPAEDTEDFGEEAAEEQAEEEPSEAEEKPTEEEPAEEPKEEAPEKEKKDKKAKKKK